MRFGKRSGTWAEAGRRLWGDRSDAASTAEAVQEEGFTVDDDTYESESRAAMAPDTQVTSGDAAPEPYMDADPTQRLLTVLGRFQRQVNLADAGAPADQWVDACLDQVVNGIEIAYESNWDGVKEALTDTARVLQSYDEGGDPHGAVTFLLDAYEILCLMVGDLIVDNVRSGVMRKWRERYSMAVEHLQSIGYRLVEDESESRGAQQSGSPSNITPFQPRAASPLDEPDVEVREVSDATHEEEDDEDDMPFEPPSFQEPVDALSAPAPAWDEDENPYLEQELDAAEEMVEEAEAIDEYVDEPEDAVEVAQDDAPEEDDVETFEYIAIDETVDEATESAEVPAEDPLLAVFDVEAEHAPESDAAAEPEPIQAVLEVEPPAAKATPVPPPQQDLFDLAMSELEAASDGGEEGHVKEELGLLDLEPEAEEETADEVLEETIAEAEELLEEATPEPEAVAPEPEPEPAPAPVLNTPESIWTSAREAMTRGDVSDAKMLALRLAADMAILETRRAEDSVSEAVDLLEQVDAAIVDADQRVSDSETHLEDTQQQRTGLEQDLETKREQVVAAEEVVTEVEGSIADIEQQIAELQAKLAEEGKRLKASQEALEAEQNDEQTISEGIAQLRELEDASRAALEDARKQAGDLREEREVRQKSKAGREAHLTKLRSSLDGIEQTLRLVSGEPEGDS
ncbi:MAG: hypothetical protein GC168_13925 [Candidatus Hydrogenedens sp.]|nr:hypothetical protein [Candidatus Hydrogenedens sp.]